MKISFIFGCSFFFFNPKISRFSLFFKSFYILATFGIGSNKEYFQKKITSYVQFLPVEILRKVLPKVETDLPISIYRNSQNCQKLSHIIVSKVLSQSNFNKAQKILEKINSKIKTNLQFMCLLRLPQALKKRTFNLQNKIEHVFFITSDTLLITTDQSIILFSPEKSNQKIIENVTKKNIKAITAKKNKYAYINNNTLHIQNKQIPLPQIDSDPIGVHLYENGSKCIVVYPHLIRNIDTSGQSPKIYSLSNPYEATNNSSYLLNTAPAASDPILLIDLSDNTTKGINLKSQALFTSKMSASKMRSLNLNSGLSLMAIQNQLKIFSFYDAITRNNTDAPQKTLTTQNNINQFGFNSNGTSFFAASNNKLTVWKFEGFYSMLRDQINQNNKWYNRLRKRESLLLLGTGVGAASLASWMAYKKGLLPTNTIRKVGEYVKPWKWKLPKWKFWQK